MASEISIGARSGWVSHLACQVHHFVRKCGGGRASYLMSSKRENTVSQILGRTPNRHSPGKRNEEIRFAVGKSSLGAVLVATGDKGVIAILVGEEHDQLLGDLEEYFPDAHFAGKDRESQSYVLSVVRYIEDPSAGLDLPLDIRGTAFQKKVWQAVREIPAGETSTYTEVARKIGAPKAMRAVGNACSTNKLALAVPCHRVLRSDGSFSGGLHWGTGRQGVLVRREAKASS